MVAELQEFARKNMGLDPASVTAEFPWGRLFEINAEVSPVPKYPVLLTRAEKQRIAAEKARKEAEEKAKLAAQQGKTSGAPAAAQQPASGDGRSEIVWQPAGQE